MVGSHPRNQIDGTQTDQSENGWYTDRSKEGIIRHVRNLEVQTAMRCRTEEPCATNVDQASVGFDLDYKTY